MAFGLTMGTERATALQKAIEDELMKRQYSTEPDPVMAEYITIMVINNKSSTQIASELEDLVGSDFDASFVDWLFAEAGKNAPAADLPSAPEASTSTTTPARDSDLLPHQQVDSPRPSNGARTGAPLYQQAISQAIPSAVSPPQKRTASARSPSPSGHPPSKSRRTDHLPTGPRAMQHRDRDRDGHGSRSLLDRMGPRNQRGPGPQFNPHDDVQARIDSITNGDPNMQMMMNGGGFPMGGMPGMDMGAMGMGNPMMLQELMLNQMAMMSQIAGAMGLVNPAAGLMNGFPGQPGMGGEMNGFNGMNGGMGQGDGGRGRGRGRGGPMRGGRGRGGHNGHHNPADPRNATAETTSTPPASAVAQPAPAPQAKPTPPVAAPTPITPSPSTGSVRSNFVAPERPLSPTLCKFGPRCTNPVCRYSHPSPVATPESGMVLSNDPCEKGKDCKDKDCIKAHVSPAVLNPKAEPPKPAAFTPPAAPTPQSGVPCRYGASCTRPGCSFTHPRPSNHATSVPCKFGTACTRSTCTFQHPEGRVLPSTFHRGLAPTGATAPEAGQMGAPSPHKSVTFKRPDGTPTTAAELEKQVREMEARKSEAEKAIAQAQSGKKDEAAPSVPISA